MPLVNEKNELQLQAWQAHQTIIIYDENTQGRPRLIPGTPAILVAASVQEAQAAFVDLQPGARVTDP